METKKEYKLTFATPHAVGKRTVTGASLEGVATAAANFERYGYTLTTSAIVVQEEQELSEEEKAKLEAAIAAARDIINPEER